MPDMQPSHSMNLSSRNEGTIESTQFDHAIGLGPACRTGFQIRRVFGRGRCLPSVFDRQSTPLATILEHFDRDFRGMFEREDFSLRVPIVNTRFGTSNMHGFGEDLGCRFPEMRAEHDKLCRTMRNVLASPRKILFVIEVDSRDFCDAVAAAIARRRPINSFQMVVGVHDPHPAATWKGNDDVWDRVLARYAVRRTLECSLIEWRRRLEKHAFGKYRS